MKSSRFSYVFFLSFLFLVLFFLSACEHKVKKRVYDEVTEPALTSLEEKGPYSLLKEMLARGEDPHAFMKEAAGMGSAAQMPGTVNPQVMASKADISLFWQIPEGWMEKPAGNLRLASLKSKNESSLDVSIVALGGTAGGISANINRWLKQINLPEMDEVELNQFLTKQEEFISSGGLKITIVDLTLLQSQRDPSTSSLLAAIVKFPDRTVFVKMVGTLTDVNKNRVAFRSLCQSLKVKQ